MTGEHTDAQTTMTVREVAAQLRVSLPTAYALCRQPKFPAARVGGQIRIPRQAFQDWLNREAQGDRYVG